MTDQAYKHALFEYLLPYVTENKKQRFEDILSQRTRSLTVVLEDIFKSHNASAVLRTAECLGLQDVHVVEQDNSFNLNPYVLRGSGKWLTVHHHRRVVGESTIRKCFSKLKEDGYQVLATTPHHGAVNYQEASLGDRVAVVFGSEENGVSDYVLENADGLIKIPMFGFTESYNISVSAAMVLENYNYKLRSRSGWELSEEELFDLRLEWMQKSVTKIEAHIRKFEKGLSGIKTTKT